MREEQVTFITGASRGFGQAAAHELARRGHPVVSTMRNPERDGEAAIGEFPDLISVTQCDVTDDDSVAQAVDFAHQLHGRVDAVFNNAGYGLYGPVEELQDEEVQRQFDTNVGGQIRVVRHVMPHMRKQGHGKIINVASLAGRVSSPLMGLYAASKHAVEAVTVALRFEAEAAGIDVTILEPGMYVSDWQYGSLDVTQAVREGRSCMQAVVDETLEAFRAVALTRPGSQAVAIAVADIIGLEQRLPMRWPVGEDTAQGIETLRTTTDATWEELMRNSVGPSGVFAQASQKASEGTQQRGWTTPRW
jgi:NAD(P)-dependent dehydrogenase (short-subunit alcohol dehydrogenase family)